MINSCAADQNLTTLRNRIAESVAEALVQSQGASRIVSYRAYNILPIKRVLGRTANLEFRMVAKMPKTTPYSSHRPKPSFQSVHGPPVLLERHYRYR